MPCCQASTIKSAAGWWHLSCHQEMGHMASLSELALIPLKVSHSCPGTLLPSSIQSMCICWDFTPWIGRMQFTSLGNGSSRLGHVSCLAVCSTQVSPSRVLVICLFLCLVVTRTLFLLALEHHTLYPFWFLYALPVYLLTVPFIEPILTCPNLGVLSVCWWNFGDKIGNYFYWQKWY